MLLKITSFKLFLKVHVYLNSNQFDVVKKLPVSATNLCP